MNHKAIMKKLFVAFLLALFTFSLAYQILEYVGIESLNRSVVPRAYGWIGSPPYYYCDNGTIEGIQEGVDNASVTGGTVVVPYGAWSFAATDTDFVNITNCNITLLGAGAFRTNLTLPPDETAYDGVSMFRVAGYTDQQKINISGISFFGRIGDNANFTGDTGVSLIAAKDFQVHNCTFANMGSTGVGIGSHGYEEYYSQGVIWNCTFINNHKPAAYNVTGMWVRYGASSLNITEESLILTNAFNGWGYGVSIEKTYSTDNATVKWVDNASYYFGQGDNHTFIENCVFDGHRHSVIGFGAANFVVRNCTFDRMYAPYESGHIDQHGAYEDAYGGHTYEAYNNTFYNSYSEWNSSRHLFAGFKIRGGNGIATQNTFYNYTTCIWGGVDNTTAPWSSVCMAKWNYWTDYTMYNCSSFFSVDWGVWAEDNVTAINYTRAFLPAGWTPYTFPHPLRAGALTDEPTDGYTDWFFSDYEDVDPEWTGIVEQGSGSTVDLNSTNVVYAGSQSGEYNFTTGSNIGAYSYYVSNHTFYNCTLSAWINTNTTASWRRWLELRNESDGSNIFTLLSSYGDWRIYYPNGSSMSQSDSTYAYSADQWNNVTTHHFFNETNGYHRVWINTTLVFNLTGLNNSVLRGGVQWLRIGAPTMSDTYANTSAWFDNVLFRVNSDEVPTPQGLSVTLNQPANDATWTQMICLFNYTPTWLGTAAQNASLWMNVSGSWQSVQGNISTIQNATINTLNYTFTASTYIIWNVQVYNTTHDVFAYLNRTLTVTLTNENITVTLNQPTNASSTTDVTVYFNSTITWVGTAAQNASLWMNVSGSWQLAQQNTTTVINNTLHTIPYTFSVNATYIWNVQSFNTTYEVWGEHNFTLTVSILIGVYSDPVIMSVDGDTYYHRSDTHTVNNLTAYQLQVTQTASDLTLTESFSGNVRVEWGFRVWLVHSAGTTSELTSGTPEGVLFRLVNGTGILNNTWTPDLTYLNIGFDAIRITIYMRFNGSGSWTAKATYVTSELLYRAIENEIWCFNLWTTRTENATHTIGSFTFGSVTYNSRVVNVHFTDPTARELMMYNLQSGQLFSFFAFPYVNLIGVLFWGIIYFIMCGGLLMRYKSSTPVLLLLVLFGGAGGVGSILIAGVGLEIAWIFALISLAALLYRLVR